MPSNARMTIRFEPQAKPKAKPSELPAVIQTEPQTKPSGLPAVLQTEPIEIIPKSQDKSTSAPPAFEAWNGAYQDDIHSLEEIIRKTDSPQSLLPEKAFSSMRNLKKPAETSRTSRCWNGWNERAKIQRTSLQTGTGTIKRSDPATAGTIR